MWAVWPSLDKGNIEALRVLLRENPCPNDMTIQVWCRALGTEVVHMRNWIDLNVPRVTVSTQEHHMIRFDVSHT